MAQEVPDRWSTPYDGKTYPREFVHMYSTAVEIAGGDDKAKANYFPMKLQDNVRRWMMHLPANSIGSWPELYGKFIGAFTGGVHPSKIISDLRRVV